MKWFSFLWPVSPGIDKQYVDEYVTRNYDRFRPGAEMFYVVNNRPVNAEEVNEALQYWTEATLYGITAMSTSNAWFIFITGTCDHKKKKKRK